MKSVVLLQGLNTHPQQIKDCYKKCDVIFSTTDTNADLLLDTNFTIVINKEPRIPGNKNLNYQVTNTYNGILKAEEMGYEYVFKIRADITIPEVNRLMELMGEPTNTLFFPAFHDYKGGYLCDYMVYGRIDHMKSLWNIPESNDHAPPEVQITKHYTTNLPNIKVDYILPIAYEHGIEIRWEKRQISLHEYRQDNLYVYDRFK